MRYLMAIAFAVGSVCGVVLEHNASDVQAQARKVVQQCEKSIPRDQTCVVVITAKVKEKM